MVEVREIYWANERTAMLIEQGGTYIYVVLLLLLSACNNNFYNNNYYYNIIIGDSGALKFAGELRTWNFNWLFKHL